MILAGDIGGTKTVLALFEPGDEVRKVFELKFSSREHPTFHGLLDQFLAAAGAPTLAGCCFGVAGPVVEGRVQTTNLPWVLDERELAAHCHTPVAVLLNDLEATSFGMLFLPASEFAVLNEGVRPARHGNVGIVAAGTGLGEGLLYWDGAHYHPAPSEGGHADFAPRNELEVELWRYLSARFGGHVSYERVLSGPGLRNVYEFLRDTGKAAEPEGLAAELKTGDPSAIISRHGLSHDVPICAQTLELFVSIYAAEASNVALKWVAVGGVYLAGGIAPKILPALQTPVFLNSFFDKGRLQSFVREIDVKVALNPQAPLIGAANFCARTIREGSGTQK